MQSVAFFTLRKTVLYKSKYKSEKPRGEHVYQNEGFANKITYSNDLNSSIASLNYLSHTNLYAAF